MVRHLLLAAGIVSFALATAHAGITDPPPVGLKHVWTIPGVINNVNIGAVFICTATETVIVSVEVFDAAGTLQSNGASATLSAGETVTYATQTVANVLSPQTLGVTTAFQGSARVVASSPKVVCAALLVDTFGSLIATLPTVKKIKQKGD